MDIMGINTMSTPSGETVHYETKEEKKYASNAKGNAGLTLGIIGTALAGLNMLGTGAGILGIGGSKSSSTTSDTQYLERKQNAEYIQITKDYYENKLSSLRELTNSFYTLDQKIQNAKDTASVESRANFDALNKRIIDLEKSDAVMKATQPLLQEINTLKLDYVNKSAQDGIAGAHASAKNMVEQLGLVTNSQIQFEAERRRCGDNTIVNYCNSTFYPKYIADITTAYTTTQQPTFNPLLPPIPPM